VKHLTNADIIKAYAAIPQQLIEGFGDQGDLTRQYMLNPALFSLLGEVHDTNILDAGCWRGAALVSPASSHRMPFTAMPCSASKPSSLASSTSKPIFQPGCQWRPLSTL
jgi:hypothetical protein